MNRQWFYQINIFISVFEATHILINGTFWLLFCILSDCPVYGDFCSLVFKQSDICVVPFQIILAFCWVYIRKFQSRQESEVVSTITAICALAIALITSALLPVDIFLVSFMKYPNGTYKVCKAFNVSTCLDAIVHSASVTMMSYFKRVCQLNN